MNVYLINFTKNHKTTAVPNLTGLTPITAKLKAPCTLLDPVLEIQVTPSSQQSFSAANYAYIPEFSRYYYIVKCTFAGNLMILTLKVDVLASWKSVITASSQYVLRSASTYDGTIKDTKYPIKAVNPNHSITYGDQRSNPLQPGSGSYGVFVVGVVSKGGSLSGCVSYYAMSYLVFIDFMLKLFNLNTQWQGTGSDIADGLKKAITDPMQYVVSCNWYPYSVNDFVNRGFASASYYITVGYDQIQLSAQCYPFDNVLNIEFTNLLSMSLPSHPQAASRGSYMNMEPFSRYYLTFYPFCSLAELDSTKVGGMGTVYLVYTVDLRTGKGILSVCTSINGTNYTDWTPKAPIRVFEAQIGVPIPVATIHTEMQNMSQFITNVGVAAGSEFGGFKQLGSRLVDTVSGWLASGLKSMWTGDEAMQSALDQFKSELQPINLDDVSNVASNAAAMKSTCEMLGTQGTMSGYSRMPVALWGDFYAVSDDSLSKYGRPCCKTLTLSTLSGFVQCDNPQISGAGMTLPEQLEIEQSLAQGVYINP